MQLAVTFCSIAPFYRSLNEEVTQLFYSQPTYHVTRSCKIETNTQKEC